jgi:hypothetical protein
LLPAVVPVEGVEAAAAAGVNPAAAFLPEASRSVTIPRDAVRWQVQGRYRHRKA